MNHVSIIGQVEGQPQLVYESPNGDSKKLFRFILKVERLNKAKNEKQNYDFINIKIWNSLINDIEMLQEGSAVALEGRLVSFGDGQHNTMLNEVIANRLNYLY